jgi:hypothetical protein
VRRAALLRSAFRACGLNFAIYPPGPDAKYQSQANNDPHKGKKCDHADDHRYGYRQRANYDHDQVCQRIAGREPFVFAVLIHVINSQLFYPTIEAFEPWHPGLATVV